jgi:hypothetical protein
MDRVQEMIEKKVAEIRTRKQQLRKGLLRRKRILISLGIAVVLGVVLSTGCLYGLCWWCIVWNYNHTKIEKIVCCKVWP